MTVLELRPELLARISVELLHVHNKEPTSLRPSLRSIHAKQTRHRIFLAQNLPEPFDFQFSIVR